MIQKIIDNVNFIIKRINSFSFWEAVIFTAWIGLIIIYFLWSWYRRRERKKIFKFFLDIYLLSRKKKLGNEKNELVQKPKLVSIKIHRPGKPTIEKKNITMNEVDQLLHDQNGVKEKNEKRNEADVNKSASNESCPIEKKDDSSLNKDKL